MHDHVQLGEPPHQVAAEAAVVDDPGARGQVAERAVEPRRRVARLVRGVRHQDRERGQREQRTPPTTSSRSRRSTGAARRGPAARQPRRAERPGRPPPARCASSRSPTAPRARAAATSNHGTRSARRSLRHDGQRQDDDQHGDPGLGVVGRVPLVEVLGPRAHAEHGREQAGADRGEQRDRRRQHRHRGHPGQGAARVTAVEGEPEHRDHADHDPDRPHPVAHRPDPRHRHEQPRRPPGVPGPLPGRDGHHDQEVADQLGAHRDARRARDQGEDDEQRGDGRLGLASAGPVDGDSEGQEQQPGQPRDAGQAEPVLGLRHHHLGQPLGRDPVRGREAAHRARVAQRPVAAQELVPEPQVEVGVEVVQRSGRPATRTPPTTASTTKVATERTGRTSPRERVTSCCATGPATPPGRAA